MTRNLHFFIELLNTAVNLGAEDVVHLCSLFVCCPQHPPARAGQRVTCKHKEGKFQGTCLSPFIMLHQGHNKQVNFVQAPVHEIWNKEMSPAGVELSFFVKVCHLGTGFPCFMPSLYILLDWNETILRTLNCDPILQLQRNLAFLCYLARLPLDPSTACAQRMSGLNVRFF